MTIAQTYDIPFGHGRKYGGNMNRYVDYGLGGWTLSGVTSFYSGLPFTPNLTGLSNRPNQGPGGRPDIGIWRSLTLQTRTAITGWLTTADGTINGAFAVPAANTFGNYGYNTLRGPIFINQDLSVAKNFKLTERFRTSLQRRGL